MEVPGDFDRNYQDKHIRESIECSAGSEYIAKIKTSPGYALIPYSSPWRALVDLEKGICDVEKRQKHNEKPNTAIKSTLRLNRKCPAIQKQNRDFRATDGGTINDRCYVVHLFGWLSNEHSFTRRLASYSDDYACLRFCQVPLMYTTMNFHHD